jgi:hypothetical protein
MSHPQLGEGICSINTLLISSLLSTENRIWRANAPDFLSLKISLVGGERSTQGKAPTRRDSPQVVLTVDINKKTRANKANGRRGKVTPIEILAAVFAVLILVKLTVVATRPDLWMGMAEAALGKPSLTMAVYLILAGIVGYYVFASLTIVEVAAVMLFTALLMGLGLLPFSQSLLKEARAALEKEPGVFRRFWLAMAIWATIALWVLYAVLF